MKLEWAESARSNLRQLREYIAEDSPENADRFIAKIIASVEALTDQPNMGREVPEADNREDVRELIFQNYRIIYLVKSERIYIVSVVHGSRDIKHFKTKPWDTA